MEVRDVEEERRAEEVGLPGEVDREVAAGGVVGLERLRDGEVDREVASGLEVDFLPSRPGEESMWLEKSVDPRLNEVFSVNSMLMVLRPASLPRNTSRPNSSSW